GIQLDESQPGFRHFFIKPQANKNIGWVKGNYHSINGNIEVSWTNKDNAFALSVSVPANTEATVVMPDGKTQKVGSGKHEFKTLLK
ncbi:MAG: hypothetical protein LBS63_00285, partial [Prevotellaceae bacterium]|nr:hypothetical protein [Prevotellaceae bacterium]